MKPTFFPTFFPSAAALRRWFAAHHDSEPELLIGFYEKSSGKPSVTYSYERETAQFDPDLERAFKAEPRAWEFFQAQPPGYRRIVTWYVVSAKKAETRMTPLNRVIGCSTKGQRLPMMEGTKAEGQEGTKGSKT